MIVMAEAKLQKLLDIHRSLVYDKEAQKIKCILTTHEMPARPSAIESYVSGKKYKRLAGLTPLVEDHKEHIVQNRKKEKELFCNLTMRHLEKTPKAIQRHISGRKYKNALARWKECQREGTPFTPNNYRKAKKPKDTEDGDDDKEAGDEDKDEEDQDEDDDDDDAGSDGTVVEDEMTDDDDDDVEDDDDEDSDDMSDLYPAADFQDDEEEKENEEVEEEDEEEEEEEVEVKDRNSNGRTGSKRSKAMNGHGPGPAKTRKLKTRKT